MFNTAGLEKPADRATPLHEHEHSLPDVAFGLAAGSSVASEVGSTASRGG
jgi:hypothetical protein